MDKYLEFVHKNAEILGKVFFLDTGEGNDWQSKNGEWYVEDLSGWLVEKSDAEDFRELFLREGAAGINNHKNYASTYCFVFWSKNDNNNGLSSPVKIQFIQASDIGS